MEITQYLKSVLRWWWLILLSTGIAAAVSYYASLQQPRIYQTTTTLLVGQLTQKTDISGNDFVLSERLAESYAQMAVRQPVLQATVDSLGLKMGWQGLKGQVYAYPIPRTQLLGINVQDVSPQRAVAIADEIARQLILQSPASPENLQRQERGQFVHSQLNDLEEKILTAQVRAKELDAELSTAFSARQIQDLQTEIATLEGLINNWQVNYKDLLGFLEGGDSPNFLTIIEPAQLSTRPVSPNVQINVLLAAAVGFMLAFGAALVLEYLDDTVKLPEDLSILFDLPSLGSISNIEGRDYKDKLVTSHHPFSPVPEAYRLVRSNIQFMDVDQTIKSIMITSPNPGEGKSITVANLGITLAQADFRTIIVDADLRQPSLYKIFQVSNSGGLTDLLRSSEPDVDNQLKYTGVENLQLITSGPLPPNPSELLGSQRMAQLLEHLYEIADLIILDSPPVLAVTDPIALSNRVEGVILVAQAKRTRRDTIKQAIKRLDRVGTRMLGVVLNQVSGKDGRYLKYAQYYARSEHEQASQPGYSTQRRWWQRLPVLK